MVHGSSSRIGSEFWEHLIQYAVVKGSAGCVAILLPKIDYKAIAALVDIAR